jgi:O-antigen/teichoic acid export membrane protein
MRNAQRRATWALPLMWMSRIRLARNAAFSLTQIIVSTVTLFWMYRRSAIVVGLSGLGAWSITTGLVSLLVVADLGVTDAMVREVARLRSMQDWTRMRRTILSCSIYVAFVIVLVGLVTYPLIHLYLGRVIHHDVTLRIDVLILNSMIIVALNTVAVGLLGAIEGFEHYNLRLVVTACGSSLLVASSYYFLPRFGTIGISLSYMVQSIVNLLVAVFIVRNLVPKGHSRDSHFSLQEVRQMARIGVPMRLGGLVNLTYEPITRLLVARFGGIESAGIYEAAVRCGVQVKAMIVACIQVVVPRFSALAVNGTDALRSLLQVAYRITGLLVVGALPLLLLSTPLISVLLLGRLDAKFQLFAEILSVGWLINALAAPSSFANLADGRLFWNWLSNVCAAAINPAVGLVLGRVYGAIGVVIGTACALTSMALIAVIARRLTAKDRIPRPGAGAVLLLMIAGLLVTGRFIVSACSSDKLTILETSLALSAFFALIWLIIAFRSIKRMVHDAGAAKP